MKQNSKSHKYNKKGYDRNDSKRERGSKYNDRRENARGSEKCEPSTQNDASWYRSSQKLLNDAGRLSFNNPLGSSIPFALADGTIADSYMPGVMAIPLVTGPGYSNNTNSAVNIAARTVYSYVRKANSGSKNYDPSDLMMYLLAMDSAYQWYSTIVRLYGTCMFYSSRNRYYGRTVVEAQGFNYDDVINNIAKLRYAINRYVRQIGSLCVPSGMSIFQRHTWLFSGYYLDNDTPKSQIYMFRPAGLYFYEETEGPGYLDYIGLESCAEDGKLLTVSDIETVCSKFADTLMQSEDIGTMSGDILKAYGEGGLLTLAMIPDDFVIAPSYSTEVLSQINNAYLNMIDVDSMVYNKLNITQVIENDLRTHISWTPRILSSAYDGWKLESSGVGPRLRKLDMGNTRILNSHIIDPTPDDVMVMSRLTTFTKNTNDDSAADVEFICGTEFALPAVVYTMTDAGIPSSASYYSMIADVQQRGFNGIRFSNFKDAPIQYIQYGSQWQPLGSIDNYVAVSRDEIEKLHEVAILSMWSVPEMGFYQP